MILNDTDFKDIQALVVKGYKNLAFTSYLLLKIVDSEKVKSWLNSNINIFTSANDKADSLAVNIACTRHAIQKLCPDGVLDGFSKEFQMGMTTPHKRRILGDTGSNSPEYWQWSGQNNWDVDILLLCYAKDESTLNKFKSTIICNVEIHGLSLILEKNSNTTMGNKEHFGFSDGLGQPYISEFDTKKKRLEDNPVALGEILLGYKNGYERYTQRPLVDKSMDIKDCLEDDVEGSGKKDLGKNGSYLVFRQLEQDVKTFWQYMQSESENSEKAILLASKMVGRWPSGTSLVDSPKIDSADKKNKNQFLYHHTDKEGFKCPLGAHVRRTNPRDSLEPEPGSKKSIEFSNRHRILRRGRPYGEVFRQSLDVIDFIDNLSQPDETERGLLFICLNANIGRQFEFVQHTWSNNRNFNGLYNDPDPITGNRNRDEEQGNSESNRENNFTIQTVPLRKKTRNMPEFVSVKGGEYFFLPSIRAIKFIASI